MVVKVVTPKMEQVLTQWATTHGVNKVSPHSIPSSAYGISGNSVTINTDKLPSGLKMQLGQMTGGRRRTHRHHRKSRKARKTNKSRRSH
jgi:hypothetical protein